MATQDRLPLVLCGMFYDLWLDPNKKVYRNSKNLREKLIIIHLKGLSSIGDFLSF